ncbi:MULTISPECIES: ABC transporter permease [unclassified Chelatococcus]|uniref:ABC transporter permease n=1 Tax=unclassified Chelatococcus TaxID=2638111 RepID=UPI001BD0A89C|nr:MULTISPECIES: ABC transporter permease [unclassified Chelatococcus]MBS7700679.1 ABC transporter permease [Chelatococcus sp. YT9]MBX3559110.1 ABC transporter permease [Chelatococcus sp.]
MKRELNLTPSLRGLVGGLLGLVILAAAFISTVWTPADPNRLNVIRRLAAPAGAYPLGTDEFGRDVLSRIMTGAWTSLSLAFLTVLAAIVVGGVIGLVSGFFRGWIDRVVMMLNDALLAFPGILLALGLVTIIGPQRYGIVLALGIAFIPTVVRVVRSTVLSLRQREYVEASRALGNGPFYTLARHVLPNALAPIAVLATSMFGWAILLESALSFLGLGVPPPAATWGNMLSAARPYLATAPWLSIIPGACIAMTLLSVNLLGDTLRDRLDPRMRRA